MIRLVPNQSGAVKRTPQFKFLFDGQPVLAHQGETVLAALMRAGIKHLRNAPTDGSPRGAFCCMGLCQECVVLVDGSIVESCRQLVADGLVVTRVLGGKHG